MRVRYVDLALDESARRPGQDDTVRALLPIGMVDLDEKDDYVIVRTSSSEFTTFPRKAGDNITHSYEPSLRDRARADAAGSMLSRASAVGQSAVTDGSGLAEPRGAEFYDHDDFDDQQAYGKRRATAPSDARVEPIARRASSPGVSQTRERVVDRAPGSDAAANMDPRERLSVEADNLRDFATGRGDGQSGLSNLGDPIKP